MIGGEGGRKRSFLPPPLSLPSPPPMRKGEREREKEKGDRARMCPVPGGRGEGGCCFLFKKKKIGRRESGREDAGSGETSSTKKEDA